MGSKNIKKIILTCFLLLGAFQIPIQQGKNTFDVRYENWTSWWYNLL